MRRGKPAERLDAWQQHLWTIFGPSQVQAGDATGFRGGSIRVNDIGSLVLSEVSADPMVVHWAQRSVASAPDPDVYKVGVQLLGNCVVAQDDREAVLKPGDFTIFDPRRPFRLAYEGSYRTLLVMLPKKSLPFDARQMTRVGAVRVPGQQGLGALVSVFLTRLAVEADYLGGQGAERLSDNVLSLLSIVYAQYLDQGPDIPASARRNAIRLQVKHYIEQRLDDPDLTPASIAAAHHISTRYLHRIFEEEDVTVARWIRMRRLENIRRDLANPLLAERRVGDVGAHWGLANPSEFSRLFREAYGVSPRTYRASANA